MFGCNGQAAPPARHAPIIGSGALEFGPIRHTGQSRGSAGSRDSTVDVDRGTDVVVVDGGAATAFPPQPASITIRAATQTRLTNADGTPRRL